MSDGNGIEVTLRAGEVVYTAAEVRGMMAEVKWPGIGDLRHDAGEGAR